MNKVLVISNIAASYRIDIYKRFIEEYDCYFLFFNDKTSKHKRIINISDTKISSRTIGNFPNTMFSVFKVLSSNVYKFDIIINAGLNYSSFCCVLFKPFFRYKLLNWWGGTISSETKISYLKFLFRNLNWKFYDGAICYSDLSLKYLESLKKENKKFTVIGNNTYDPVSKCLKKTKTYDFINVAFQDKRKNTIIILKAYKLLKEKISKNISLIIVGNGPEINNLIKYSIEHSLDVTFTKNISTDLVDKYYKSSKIFIHNATIDQWPQTYNEALKNRLPAIVSCASGISDYYINKNKSVVSYETNDYKTLSKIMGNLLENDNLYSSLLADIEVNLVEYNSVTAFTKIGTLLKKLQND